MTVSWDVSVSSGLVTVEDDFSMLPGASLKLGLDHMNSRRSHPGRLCPGSRKGLRSSFGRHGPEACQISGHMEWRQPCPLCQPAPSWNAA